MVQGLDKRFFKGLFMGVPKSKVTRSRRNLRRSHDSLSPAQYSECGNCGELKLSHHICASCGYYGHGEKQKSILRTVEQDIVDDDDD